MDSYSTLTTLWAQASKKPMPVISNSGFVALIYTDAQNGWFLGQPMSMSGNYYAADYTVVLLPGDEAIWSPL